MGGSVQNHSVTWKGLIQATGIKWRKGILHLLYMVINFYDHNYNIFIADSGVSQWVSLENMSFACPS